MTTATAPTAPVPLVGAEVLKNGARLLAAVANKRYGYVTDKDLADALTAGARVVLPDASWEVVHELAGETHAAFRQWLDAERQRDQHLPAALRVSPVTVACRRDVMHYAMRLAATEFLLHRVLDEARQRP
jgi:hypothetical protein